MERGRQAGIVYIDAGDNAFTSHGRASCQWLQRTRHASRMHPQPHSHVSPFRFS
jgi:hypothetical protein